MFLLWKFLTVAILSSAYLAEPNEKLPICNHSLGGCNFWAKLLKNYDKIQPPTRPTNATGELFLHMVTELDQLKGKAQINVNFIQRWTDPRLAFSSRDLYSNATVPEGFIFGEAEANQIWQPKLDIINAMTKYALEPTKFRRILKICVNTA